MQLINNIFKSKIKYIFLSLFVAYNFTSFINISAEVEINKSLKKTTNKRKKSSQNSKNEESATLNASNNIIEISDPKQASQLIPFSFEEESLVNIINMMAEKRNINIILPQSPDPINQQKVTFKPEGDDKITLQQAWKFLITFLELAGYTLSTQGSFYVVVKKNDQTIARHDYPLYIGINPDSLPNTDQRIQYVYFFKNLSVPDIYNPNNQEDTISQILKEVLSPFSKVMYDGKSNGIIIIDKSNNISSAMRIIREFDESGFQEVAEVIPLYYATASNVAQVLQSLIKVAANDTQNAFIGTNPKSETSVLFPTGTKVIANQQQNSLIILGRESAVMRIKDFVDQYIDIPQATGKSILHVYDLQYLDSRQFAPVLQNILLGRLERGQSTGQGALLGGPERYFQSPIVAAEVADYDAAQSKKDGVEGLRQIAGIGRATVRGLTRQIFRGGNRLVIAATQSDWIIIENLIRELDRPEPQVILEVLIVDVLAAYDKIISGSIRTRRGNCFMPRNDTIEFLASHITPARNALCRTADQCNELNSLAVDLLRLSGVAGGISSVASSLGVGSTLISFSDPRISGTTALLQLLSTFTETKVLQHPYIVTTNNKPAQVAYEDTRRILGNPRPTTSGAIETPVVAVPAARLVQFLPRISSATRLNLQIRVDINDFVGASFTRNIRTVETNTNMNSGQVLVIGGLDRHDDTDVSTNTPIFSRIPIIGQFFRGDSERDEHRNLLILISPTIVQPKLRGGLNLYTSDKLRSTRKDFSNDIIFNAKRQPITRFFFGDRNDSDIPLRKYLEGSENAPEFDQLLTKKEQINQGLLPNEPKKPVIRLPEAPPEQKARKIKDLLAYEENPLLRNQTA